MKYHTFNNISSSGIAQAIYTPMGIGNWKANNDKSLENYKILAGEFDLKSDMMVRTDQVHSANVRVITAEDAGEGITKPLTAEGYDGLITNVPNLMLCTVEADCTPVFLLDPVRRAVAMIHSGWKGTAGMISANAIDLMRENYGSQAEDLIAAIGPCICRECYEVSDDLIGPFSKHFNEDDLKRIFSPKDNGKYLLDLKRAVRLTLINKGVREENIEDSGYCTFHDNIFYSWRRDKDPDVRMLTAIYLK